MFCIFRENAAEAQLGLQMAPSPTSSPNANLATLGSRE